MQSPHHQFTLLKQICDLIPPHMVPRLVVEHGCGGKKPGNYTMAPYRVANVCLTFPCIEFERCLRHSCRLHHDQACRQRPPPSSLRLVFLIELLAPGLAGRAKRLLTRVHNRHVHED